MATLTRSQIELYALAAGLPPGLFGAIAEAESSGSTTVVNSIGCVGLWQINQPVQVKDHPTWTVAWLQDPSHNAQAAATLYRQSGTAPWVSSESVWSKDPAVTGTSTTPAGLLAPDPFGDDTTGAIPGDGSTTPSVPGLGDVQSVAGGVTSLAHLGVGAAKWLSNPQNWVRIGEVVVGAGLVLVGLVVMTRGTWEPAAQAVTKTAAKVGAMAA